MLQSIHDKLKGWLAGVVLGAIGLVFVFWGINWTMQAPTYAAKVNGSEISSNTVPSMLSSASRLLSFVLPAWWWAQQQGFQLTHVWYLSVMSITLQAILSLLLLRRQLRLRLV